MLIESPGVGECMRLMFEPLMPTLVEKPREGDYWTHEVKFARRLSSTRKGHAFSPGAGSTGRLTWPRQLVS